MVNDMKYFEMDNCIVAAYKVEDAKHIYNRTCNTPLDEDDIVELSRYEALGKFTESMAMNETFLDGYGILQFFSSTKNEILLIK